MRKGVGLDDQNGSIVPNIYICSTSRQIALLLLAAHLVLDRPRQRSEMRQLELKRREQSIAKKKSQKTNENFGPPGRSNLLTRRRRLVPDGRLISIRKTNREENTPTNQRRERERGEQSTARQNKYKYLEQQNQFVLPLVDCSPVAYGVPPNGRVSEECNRPDWASTT